MNQTQILEYIQHPSLLAQAPVAELEQLISEFPYCQATHLLYTKALYEQKNIRYHKQLNNAAAHIRDRSILYWLINGDISAKEMPADIKPNFSVSESLPDAEVLQPLTAPANKDMNVPESNTENLMARLNRLSEHHYPDYKVTELKLKDIEKQHENRIHEIVQEYLNLRLRSHALYMIQQQIAEDQKILPEKPVETNAIKEQTGINIEELYVDEKETDKDPIPSKSDLIERFISETPSMPRPKKEFFNPVNMAHKSTTDMEDLVSETLAEIHLKQGNIPKAVKIYERLCLIIPEKSAYFAARIEKIKKENNLL